MSIGSFLKELQRSDGSVKHVEYPLEVTFEWLDEDRVIVYLYKQNSEVFCKSFSLEKAYEIKEELDDTNNAESSPYSWPMLLERKQNELD